MIYGETLSAKIPDWKNIDLTFTETVISNFLKTANDCLKDQLQKKASFKPVGEEGWEVAETVIQLL